VDLYATAMFAISILMLVFFSRATCRRSPQIAGLLSRLGNFGDPCSTLLDISFKLVTVLAAVYLFWIPFNRKIVYFLGHPKLQAIYYKTHGKKPKNESTKSMIIDEIVAMRVASLAVAGMFMVIALWYFCKQLKQWILSDEVPADDTHDNSMGDVSASSREKVDEVQSGVLDKDLASGESDSKTFKSELNDNENNNAAAVSSSKSIIASSSSESVSASSSSSTESIIRQTPSRTCKLAAMAKKDN
jgi:phosphatidylglycerophosphatase A